MHVCSDRVHEANTFATPLLQFKQLVDRRLTIAGKGLAEARQYLAAGQARDADIILEKIDEDLYLLRRRLVGAVETGVPRSSVLCGRVGASSEAN
jgi:hypothetical protein